MHYMETVKDTALRGQLLDRRQKLQSAISEYDTNEHLENLLHEVDSALEKMDKGTFGLCETCDEPIEQDRLVVDPLICNCLDHLTSAEKRFLEDDLDLACQIQNTLLPKQNLSVHGWNTAYHHESVGPVSGDYCDLIIPESSDGSLFFLIGDVTGKGVAASILMAHLHAIFRSLMNASLPVDKLVKQANRIFCEATMSTHFATLVCGRANNSGEVEICNAGHCLPLLVRGDKVNSIRSTGLPLGSFCDAHFTSEKITIAAGDTLALYTDGFSEAWNTSNIQYGEERLSRVLSKRNALSPKELIDACLKDLTKFRSGVPKADDLTMMVVRRT